jgi:chaperone required for assembly of F1-ATPase
VKRFWKDVTVEREDGWTIKLDGRPLRTPARALLLVPSLKLANAIADEWREVGEDIDPAAMPLTGFANGAIDRVAPARESFADDLARYAEADLACYRAQGPGGLVELQQRSWDDLIGWARRRYDVDFVTTSGITHVAQPPATVDRLTQAVAELDPFRLAALSSLVAIGGSLVAALAVLEKALAPDAAWDAVSIDERWQLEKWGADRDAEVALQNRRRDFLAAARFLELLEI